MMSSSPVAPHHTTPVASDPRPSLTVLSGFRSAATFAVARALLVDDPSLLLVRHDLTDARDGRVHRVVRTGTTIVEDEWVGLAHGCVSCTLREDVLATLARIVRAHPGRDLVLMLPEVVEPEAVAAACAHCLVDGVPLTDQIRIDSYVTVVDAEYVLDALASDADLATLGIHVADDDHRALADVVVRQIEYADTLVLWGSCSGGAFDTAQVRALLHRLAPWAAYLHLDEDLLDVGDLARRLRRTHRHRPEASGVLARGIEGYPIGVHEPNPEHDVVSAVFRARRPFHPGRLHDVLETVNADVLRSRGHLWLASQPDTVVAWEFAGGGLGMGTLGRWLAAVPDEQWHRVSDHRRLAAAFDWDPYYGDRHQHLVFIGVDIEPVALHRTLAGCLLTDAELAEGEATWRTWPDPFAGCFPIPDPMTDTEGAVQS